MQPWRTPLRRKIQAQFDVVGHFEPQAPVAANGRVRVTADHVEGAHPDVSRAARAIQLVELELQEQKHPEQRNERAFQQPGSDEVSEGHAMPETIALHPATARRTAPGAKTTSASVKRNSSPVAASAARARAWVLPSQPSGSDVTWTTRRLGCCAASWSRMEPVASSDQSSTATTSRAG